MNHYNTYLTELREKTGLSLKEAAKQIGISRFSLYLYENGYFRPSKKALKRIESFYKSEIPLEGMSAYPVPSKEKAITEEKVALKVRRIVFGILAAVTFSVTMVGVGLFNASVNNTGSFYGEVYNETKAKVQQEGEMGHDLVTSLPFHYVSKSSDSQSGTVVFYETDNILYFNECTYSISMLTEEFGIARLHYQFGFNLAVSSYECEFNVASWSKGTYFTCIFDYHNEDKIEELKEFKVDVKGRSDVDETLALTYANLQIKEACRYFNAMLKELLGRDVDFCDEFLRDRELGRVVNSALQIVGLLLIFPGVIAFFIFFGIFIHTLVINIKPRLVTTEPKDNPKKKDPLPEDWHIRFGIPDTFVVILSKVMQYGSMFLMLVSFVTKLGLPLPAFLAEPIFLTIMKIVLLIGIFLEHFIMIGRIKNVTALFEAIIYNLGIFLFVATIETILISITNAWGYDFAHLIYRYVPSNVYQVVAVHYLIFLFLFFQPPFLNNKGKGIRILWHSLSFIPLGFLIATYFISNAYALTYGVKENIFINFWFPNGFLALSTVSVIFMYLTFALRIHYEKRFGKHNAQMYFYGDRYSINENIICSLIIIVVALLDLIFIRNQYGFYLGLGSNIWILILIPFIIFTKYSPNNQQIFLIDEVKELPSRQS